ncbi:hypothetical protein IWQ51_000400 [Labrenzia sp. EL_142]|nr:hypothetical protein [Labrenzia sp. EL_142]
MTRQFVIPAVLKWKAGIRYSIETIGRCELTNGLPGSRYGGGDKQTGKRCRDTVRPGVAIQRMSKITKSTRHP